MKKEHTIFLTLIVAAAVITGSTFGMLQNLPLIFETSQEIQKVETEKMSETTRVPANEDVEAADEEAISTYDSDPAIIMTAEEERELQQMLDNVSPGESGDYRQQIMNFQKKNMLTVTGVLDTQTLNTIVQQATQQKVQQHLHNK